jgi:hypothetical protein
MGILSDLGAGGDCTLVAGGWTLVAGGCTLVAGGCSKPPKDKANAIVQKTGAIEEAPSLKSAFRKTVGPTTIVGQAVVGRQGKSGF